MMRELKKKLKEILWCFYISFKDFLAFQRIENFVKFLKNIICQFLKALKSLSKFLKIYSLNFNCEVKLK
jgi:hypothetical protein